MSQLSVDSAKSIKAPKSNKEPKSVVSEMSVDSAKTIKAPKSNKEPKSVVSDLSVDSAKSIKAPTSVASQRGGGSVDSERYSVIFSENPIAIPYQKALKVLQKCVRCEISSDLISLSRPLSPLGGQMFPLGTQNFTNKMDRRCDNYQWNNDGTKKYPKNNPFILKTTHKIRVQVNGKYKGSADIVRHEYQLTDNDRYYLIQYTGNETAYQTLPHKSSKSGAGTYFRTCPSVIDGIITEAQYHVTACKIYNKMKSKNEDGEGTASVLPKNQGQVKNHVSLEQEKKRLLHDDIYNTVEPHYHLNDYVLQLDMVPSFACVLGLKEVLTDFGNLQQLRRKGKILCSYDTTYNCGDFYVSPIVFKHVLFDSESAVPLAFLIQEKRDQDFHERLFQILKKSLPSINRDSVVFVVDREPAITNGLESMLPNATVYIVGIISNAMFTTGSYHIRHQPNAFQHT